MDEYVVYVLYSESGDRLYIGFSSCSIERFYWHNQRSKKGFTRRYRPWKMILMEVYQTKREAMKREKQLKGGQGRAWLRSDIFAQMVLLGFISASGEGLF